MPTTPDPVFIGQLVQIPMVSGGNGGVDRCPAIITEINDPEVEDGGASVNVRPFPNNIDLNLGVIPVLFCLYKEEAEAEGFTGILNNVPQGAWPLDYTFV